MKNLLPVLQLSEREHSCLDNCWECYRRRSISAWSRSISAWSRGVPTWSRTVWTWSIRARSVPTWRIVWSRHWCRNWSLRMAVSWMVSQVLFCRIGVLDLMFVAVLSQNLLPLFFNNSVGLGFIANFDQLQIGLSFLSFAV